jgi:hypothetical protein
MEILLLEVAPMTVDERWQNVLEMTQALTSRVETMERGGDLEGLIEEGLNQIDVEIFKLLLEARERVASVEAAAFSPCGMLTVRGPDESGPSQAAPGVDPARGLGLRAQCV